jgi:acetyl-CoA carboxylase biotin carboxyl carrier protein
VSLTAADVAEILRLLEQSSFDELNLEMNGVKLSLKRGGGSAPGATAGGTAGNSVGGAAGHATLSRPAIEGSVARGVAAPATPSSPPEATPTAAPARTSDPNIHDVPSPLLGTFYRSPKPGAAPFVEVGSAVTEDTIVAIIEVMKLMNTVRAGTRGTVAEILPTDGALVEYDQPILRIRKSG